MKVLLTGVTGFIGASVVSRLMQSHEVVCLGRTDPKTSGVRFIKTDIANKASLEQAAKQCQGESFDALIHLAAYVPRTKENDTLEDMVAVNVVGTANLLEVFSGMFNKLIIGSSAEVYDQSRVTGLITETSPVAPLSYYGATKLGGEFIALSYGKKNSIPVAVLRFSVMYGGYDPIARALPNFINRALEGEKIEIRGGAVLRDYIHIDDVAASIEDALMASFSTAEILNIGTGQGASIQFAADTIVKMTNSKSEIVMIPGEGTNIVLDISRAKQVINFEPKVIFPEKLDDMIDAYK